MTDLDQEALSMSDMTCRVWQISCCQWQVLYLNYHTECQHIDYCFCCLSLASFHHYQHQLSLILMGQNIVCASFYVGGGGCEWEDHPLSLEMSQDVQDGVQLQTESLQLSALVLCQMLPVLHLWLLISIYSLPRPTNHLSGERQTVTEVSQCHQVSLWQLIYNLP